MDVKVTYGDEMGPPSPEDWVAAQIRDSLMSILCDTSCRSRYENGRVIWIDKADLDDYIPLPFPPREHGV
jgi:hypothetical protein